MDLPDLTEWVRVGLITVSAAGLLGAFGWAFFAGLAGGEPLLGVVAVSAIRGVIPFIDRLDPDPLVRRTVVTRPAHALFAAAQRLLSRRPE